MKSCEMFNGGPKVSSSYCPTQVCLVKAVTSTFQIDLEEAGHRPGGPPGNNQELINLKKTVEQQKKNLEELKIQLADKDKILAELDKKVKQVGGCCCCSPVQVFRLLCLATTVGHPVMLLLGRISLLLVKKPVLVCFPSDELTT